MTDPTAAVGAADGDYDIIPYTSKPFPQSAPPRQAALATLFTLRPPAVTEARVLELGCAAGGNIIPLAMRFPGARFRGVDLAERHVRKEATIADAVFQAVLIGVAELASVPLRLDPGAKAKAKPKAARLARLDAGARTGWTTGPDHSVVPLDVVSMVLLPLMDGTRDRDALKAGLLAAVRDKIIRLQDANSGLEPTGASLDAAAAKHVEHAIERLTNARLLG